MIFREKKKEEGQSTVEFALTLILMMAFLFFFLQLSLIFGFGNYVHYATFMSARAYLSGGPSKDDQLSRAKNVIVSTMKVSQTLSNRDRFPFIGKGTGGGDPNGFGQDSSGNQAFQSGTRTLSWLQGVRYTFQSRLFPLPLGGSTPASGGASANQLTLTSESWLGREPSESDCVEEMMKLNGNVVVIDNGC